ncbi:glyoxalase [Flavobacteriales bacterium 34_180_T64]|nr:glyoxalase [Flavobacteriales bacterium 34_180_T64]
MTNRSTNLKAIRPVITSALIYDSMSSEERFQNQTLRPIIKMQENLFIAVFRNYIVKHKSVFYDFTLERQLDYIESAIHKDMKFRNSVKGMIIGQFTIEEYALYIMNSSALNKRMMNIVKGGLINHIQILEKKVA